MRRHFAVLLVVFRVRVGDWRKEDVGEEEMGTSYFWFIPILSRVN